ncbi:MAG: hypothetical protein ACYSTZ_00250 [Planctomycetota bacterium]|jgi:hypothetical protein
MTRVAWIPIAFALCCLAGCVTGQAGEPVIAPETVETIDAIASVVEPVGASLGLFVPSAAAIGGVLAGLAGAWRRLRPKLKDAEDMAELGSLAGEATAVALEEFKAAHPEEWSTLSEYLREHHGSTVENFYRALRDLPPKG